MSKEFSRIFRVRWSETNAVGHVGLAGYLRYLIETAWDWGATGGLSMAENEALGLAWVIREMELNLYRPLVPNDVFDFTIWLLKWRRVRGTRCFKLRLKDSGELIAQGAQQVVTLDSKTLRPIRVPEHIIDHFVMKNPPVIPQRKFPKFQTQPETDFVTRRDVEWRDLDSLEHVNNAAYAAFAEDAAVQAFASVGWPPSRFKTQGLTVQYRCFHIQYQSPALWGDALNVTTYLSKLKPQGGAWHIAFERASNSESIIQCLIEWSLADRESGQEQPLPESLFRVLDETAGSAKGHNAG